MGKWDMAAVVRDEETLNTAPLQLWVRDYELNR